MSKGLLFLCAHMGETFAETVQAEGTYIANWRARGSGWTLSQDHLVYLCCKFQIRTSLSPLLR